METVVDTNRGIEHAKQSDVGLRRQNNQDSLLAFLASNEDSFRRRGHLFIVADGMGAHAAGELASKIAVDTIPQTYHKLRDKPAPLALKKAIQEANQIIYKRGQANPDFQGMGTTASALALLPSGAIVAHVGDSRVYRLRGTKLEQLSFDHSLVWELEATGQLPGGAEASAIPKNIITRSLGPNPDVEVDLEGPFPVAPGDTFLLCSDGLSGEVGDEEIGTILQCLPPEEAVQLLIDLANLRGGPDNITIIVARALPNFATNGAAADTSGSSPGMRPLVWIVLAASLLAAAGLAIFTKPVFGAVAGVVGMIATLLARKLLGRSGDDLPGGRLGRGPHRAYQCNPDLPFAQELHRIFEQLRTAAVEEDWRMDWSFIERLVDEARQAAERNDYAAATACHGRAISFMMCELKKHSGGGLA